MNEPLVTCVCLTKNRRAWLPKAIQCFQSQTYQNRELLIVSDGEDVSDLVPVADNIRLIKSDLLRVIGLKRNYANSLAKGSIIVHWDDDDFSAPGRITDQVARLLESGKSVTGYSSLIFEGEKEGRWKYVDTPDTFALGTSLCYFKSWWEDHKFPDKHVGEDGDFSRGAAHHKQLVSVDGGEMIIASIHPGNTSPRRLEGHPWKKL